MFSIKTFKGKTVDCTMQPNQEDYMILNEEKTLAVIQTYELDEDQISLLKEKFKYEE